jgi:hypothetical protein
LAEAIIDTVKTGAIGIKRMAVTICCVGAITFIDYIHTIRGENMTTGSITAIAVIAALGGVDVWKNRILKGPSHD